MSDIMQQDLLFDHAYWGQNGAPYDLLAKIRASTPILWYENSENDPVWLLTRHKDVEAVGKNSNMFLSGLRTVYHNPKGYKSPLVGLPQMDAPLHTSHRKALQSWFTGKAIRALEGRIAEIAKERVDLMAHKNEGDFCSEVAVHLPLKMICELLGIPSEQEGVVFQLARDIFAASDPELGNTDDSKVGVRNAMEFCANLGKTRQENPTDDLASAIANAEVDGEKMTIDQIASHLVIMISAGHDTTASAISGGMRALLDNPDQLEKLSNNLDLMDLAINEMLRYVTPTTSFVRTAKEDTEIDGVKIAKGDDVCLHFGAANRDPEVFENPNDFQVDRNPNPHLTFGKGPHVCIGLLLAKIEMKAFFNELLPRIKHMEIAAKPTFISSNFVTGLKSLPLRYELTSGN